MVGMHKHLHALILPQVVAGILIDGLRLTRTQVFHPHVQGLLIVLHQLWLRGVGSTTDAWRQDVVHWLFVVVLLDVDSTHLHRSRLHAVGEVLLVDTPFASHQVKTAEAQHDGLLEIGHEHTHEADAGEVVDAALLAFVLGDGNAELEPVDTRRIAIAQSHAAGAHIGDVGIRQRRTVLIGIKDLRTDMHLVLVVAFILVEREVLVDVLHVRTSLVAGVIRFGAIVGVGRVALRIVDALIAFEDALLLVVIVGAAIVVVVVAGRVVAPGRDDAVVGDDAAVHHGIEPFLIGSELTLLLIIQAVIAHILQGTRAAGGGKRVGLHGLYGYLTPLGSGE